MFEIFKVQTNSKFKKNIILLIKLLVGFGIIIFLISKLDISKISIDSFGKDIIKLIIGILSFVFAFVFVQSFRLYILLEKRSISYLSIVKLTLVSIFFNSFLPSTIGGDGFKVLYLKNKSNSGWTKPVTLVFLERFSGLFVLVLIGVVYICLFFDKIRTIFVDFNIGVNINFQLYLIILLLSLSILFLLSLIFFKKIILLIKKAINVLVSSIKIVIAIPKLILLKLLFTSIIFHLCRLLAFYFLISYFNETIFWVDLFFVLFFTAFISVIPISIGGLGLREGAITMSLVVFGISENSAILVALLSRIVIVILSVIGAITYFYTDLKKIKQQ